MTTPSSQTEPPHLSHQQFRAGVHELADFIIDYWSRLQAADPALPVLSTAEPGSILVQLPGVAPERAEAWQAIRADLDGIILRGGGLTHWQHPSFFGFFPANASAPAVLADLLCSGLGVQGMLWATSPVATELETRMLDWMADLLGLPASFLSTAPGGKGGGVIQGTASESTLVAMLAARKRAGGMHGPEGAGRLVAYTSTQAHSSVMKAAMIAGIIDGPDDDVGLRLIEVDERFAMRPEALARAMADDAAAGRRPFFVCATLGTTSSLAFDDVASIAGVLRRHGAWLHVDAAMAGSACVAQEHRWMLKGVEHADSFCFNPHKWLLTNFDCGLFYTSDRDSVTGALSVTPEYLRNTASASGAVIDYRDWQIPLGRRFRALKLWFVMRMYGAEGLRAHIREGVRQAGLLADWVRADARFELAAEPRLSLVCFRLRGEGPAADARNRALMDRLNASGAMYLTHTVLPGPEGPRLVLRMALGGTFTREEHVRAAWQRIARAVDAAGPGL